MATLTIARQGLSIVTHPVMSGASIKGPRWFQTAETPDEIIVTKSNGEQVRKALHPGTGKNRKTRVWVASVKVDGIVIIVNVTEGWDPSRPSWNYTIKAHAEKEIAACSKCGTVFQEDFDLVHDAPLCLKCRKGGTVAHE